MLIAKRAYLLLRPEERRSSWLVIAFSILVALFEVVGTVSIMPFLAVLADPGVIERNETLSRIYEQLGFSSMQNFLIGLGCASFALLFVSAVMRGFGQYVIFRFSALRGYTLGRRLMESYLRRPYTFHTARHSGELIQKLMSETFALVNRIYQPLTQLVAQLVIVVALITLLVLVNPEVALTAAAVLSLFYAAIYAGIRGYLQKLGNVRHSADKLRFRVITETFGGIKTIKLLGRERANLDRYSVAARKIAECEATSNALAIAPRFGVEILAFGGIIVLALVLLISRGDTSNPAGELLPLLGLYAFAGYRLMPALQQIYHAMTSLRIGIVALDAIEADLAGTDDLPPLPDRAEEPLVLRGEVAVQEVTFHHDGAEAPTLENVSVTLPKGKTLGVVGSTGAGKTTLMDLFLGLLTPTSGQICVDGMPVTPDRLRAWQSGIGYVPQDIFLVDGTVAENIAFGLSPDEIDRKRVEECAQMAQLADFILDQLPHGYDTMVGERGVRLSGGQRQRIGIARALYPDPDILVFDEATSSLDTVTEQAIVETIASLAGTKTMMIVAHRISTIQNCDQILVLENGRVADLGTYEDLCGGSVKFQALINARTAA